MTAALAAALRPPVQARHRPSYGDLLDLLAEEREALRDADEATALACAAVHVLVTRASEQPSNIEAERRILGAMANGRATLEDVSDLAARDFFSVDHATLFAALLAALRSEHTIGVRVRPWARRRGAEAVRHEAASVRRRAVGNALLREGAVEAWAVLGSLPQPGTCPRRDIVRVEELGRWRRGER